MPPIDASYTAKYDGKEVTVAGNAPYDMIALKRQRQYVYRRASQNGRLVQSNGTNGNLKWRKTMTATAKGTNSDGKPFTYTFVFDKQ